MDYRIAAGNRYAVLGPNGSGKSTFLQVLAGSLTPSEGAVEYRLGTDVIDVDGIFEHLSMAAPYLELVEEFTLTETIDFHFRFKKFRPGLDAPELIRLLNFGNSAHRQVRHFSSGMKQRVKLALAIGSDTPLLLLDEPTANFDEQGIQWYHSLIDRFAQGRTVVVCSNQPHEYAFCPEHIVIPDFKPRK